MLKKVFFLLSRKEKRRGAMVLALVVVMAALETAGVASVMPFLSVLANPELVEENPALRAVYDRLGFRSVDSFLFALGAASFALIIFSAAFRTLTHYAMNRFIEMRRHSIGERLLETYLRQPYAYFLNRHSGDMAKSILSEVDQLVQNVFRPGITMLAYIVVTLGIITLLVAVNPVLATVVAALVGGMYAAVFVAIRGSLTRVGRDRVRANQERFEAAGEALGGIKDIKLLGREHAYLRRFREPSIRQARSQATNRTLSEVPKYAIEAVAVGGVIGLTLFLLATEGGAHEEAVGGVLPMLGLYAFAGYRLLPAAQKIYAGAARLRFGGSTINAAYEDLRERSRLAEIHKTPPERLSTRETVSLQNVSYRYPNAHRDALKNITIDIPVGTSLGIIGTTGAGKTTLVDLLLGLLRPTRGDIAVDGRPITDENLRQWQQTLGYVPQDIFLTDSSVSENIALGVPPAQIDHDQVVKCATMAQVHQFIERDMPKGYDTVVGERGVRLSGGQRQRIGIARALYHEPEVLVFDEATSSLDVDTEREVMASIDGLSQQKTIIMIAHRLTTVSRCNQIVRLEGGRVTSSCDPAPVGVGAADRGI